MNSTRSYLDFWQKTRGCRNCILGVQRNNLNMNFSLIFVQSSLTFKLRTIAFRSSIRKFLHGWLNWILCLDEFLRENFCSEIFFLCGLWLSCFGSFSWDHSDVWRTYLQQGFESGILRFGIRLQQVHFLWRGSYYLIISEY